MSISPMMKQYLEIKDQYKDCILLFRLGDFYEMFYEDAEIASKDLELVLTGRDCGLAERAPMCGVPFHAGENYIAKLVEKGHKVAICEQTSVPEKGIAAREVIRVITPGTVMDSNMLDGDNNNYLVSICRVGDKVGISWADISTGEFNRGTIDAQIALKLNDLLIKINPSEIICNSEMLATSRNLSAVKYGNVRGFSRLDDSEYDLVKSKDIITRMCKDAESILTESDECIMATGALLGYITQTQKRNLGYIRQYDKPSDTMSIDSSAMKTLELLQSTDGKRAGSLLWALNKTETHMGARLLAKWIASPLIDSKMINARLDGIEELLNDNIGRAELRKCLHNINDIERIATRLGYGNINPMECRALAASLGYLPEVKNLLSKYKSPLLSALCSGLDTLDSVKKRIETAITDEPPKMIREGGMIREGYDTVLDKYKTISKQAKTIIARIEADEKQKTGIKTLKIGYNRVFGYYIEVSKGQTGMVPYSYIRKQTLANCERYITEELKQLEDKVLHAEENAVAREIQLYNELIEQLGAHCESIIMTAKVIAQTDVLASNAEVSAQYKYIKPIINDEISEIKIKEGRHIVVERRSGEPFVPNDTYINGADSRIMLITGPNMAGKSIYMRQVALITILSHIGFFVPAESAEISITDNIFTRVGASDDLHTGRSTFMVEMSEVSDIIKSATDKSLILLDELGRGTSTYDGLSIAWAVVEYISNNFKAKTLFSTHYHELTELEGVLDGIKNYKMTVREVGGSVVFLRKLLRGSANRSFGIEVAGLSGLPTDIIIRAKEHLSGLEKLNVARQNTSPYQQISMYNIPKSSEVIKLLRELNLDDISPRAAYDILADLQEKAKEE